MLNSVFRKTVYEKRWTLLAWAIGLFAMTLLTMAFYPFFKNSGFDEVLTNAPKSLQGLLGEAANYKTIPGYVDQQIFALRMPLLTIIMAVSIFYGLSVGDEDHGYLESLLAKPISRSRVFWQKFAAGAVISGIASLAIILGVVVSFPFIHGNMGIDRLLQATFACWLLSLAFGALAYGLGAATGKKGLTIGVASAAAFGTYLVSSLAPAVDVLATAHKYTPFYYYNIPAVAVHGLKFTNVLVLIVTIFIPCVIGLAIFLRRDLVRD